MFKKLLIIFVCFIGTGFNSIASNYYWVNGAGNWSDNANHWATSSGGNQFHPHVPTPSDDVFFDSNSFNSTADTLFLDLTLINCHSMFWNGSLPINVFSSISDVLELHGSLILIPGLNWNMQYNGSINFMSDSPDSIYTAGDTLLTNFLFSGSGEWKLLDDLNLQYDINFSNGSLFTFGHTINCYEFFTGSELYCKLDLDTSNINCFNWFVGDVASDSLVLSADQTVINCTNFSCGSNFQYNIVNANSGFGCFEGCTFNEVNVNHFFL